MKHSVVIAGVTGKMGRKIVDIIQAEFDDKFELKYGIGKFNDNTLAIPVFNELQDEEIDVVIDFSTAEYSINLMQECAKRNIPIVSGTTGFSQKHYDIMNEIANNNLILQANNTSYSINLLAHLVQIAAAQLPESFDIEILDIHHKNKIDSPSGTALMLGEAAAKARGLDFQKARIKNRNNIKQAKQQNEIGIATLRNGEDMVGEHRIMFASSDDRIELMHRASSRYIYAHGAVIAAQWLLKQKPGQLYTMRDVITIK